jgi:predicted metal-binding transcription factor (methanogenesis marker protein 9)
MPGTIRRMGHSFNLTNVKPTQCIPTDQSLSNGTKLEAGDKRCFGVGVLIITNKSNKVLSLA